LKTDIELLKYEYLDTIESSFYDSNFFDAYVLLFSIDDTVIDFDDVRIVLNKNHAIIYPFSKVNRIKKLSGVVLSLFFHGVLAEKYITEHRLSIILTFNTNNHLVGLIRRIEMMIEHKEQLDERLSCELGFGLLLDIWMYQEHTTPLPRIVLEATAIIESDYGLLYGVDDLADRVGVNKSHLIRQFKASLKTTPGDYLEKIRIERAKMYLSAKAFSIDMVAKLCGYSCANYFSKVFKKRTGISPSLFKDIDFDKSDTVINDEIYL
jgi:AraC-like DNA-binding protein